MSGVRVAFRPGRCSGIGMCEAIAPEVFTVGDDGHAEASGEILDGALRDRLDQAAGSCPTQAFTIEAEDGV